MPKLWNQSGSSRFPSGLERSISSVSQFPWPNYWKYYKLAARQLWTLLSVLNNNEYMVLSRAVWREEWEGHKIEGKIKIQKILFVLLPEINFFKSKGSRWQIKLEGSQFENGIGAPVAFPQVGKKKRVLSFSLLELKPQWIFYVIMFQIL